MPRHGHSGGAGAGVAGGPATAGAATGGAAAASPAAHGATSAAHGATSAVPAGGGGLPGGGGGRPGTWDAIRGAVRRHRTEQPPPLAFAVPRGFAFDDAAGRLYFLALEVVAGRAPALGTPPRGRGRPRAPSMPAPAAPPLRTWSIFYAALDRPAAPGIGHTDGPRRRRKSYADVAAALSRLEQKLLAGPGGSDDDDDDATAAASQARPSTAGTYADAANSSDDGDLASEHGAAYVGITNSPGSAASLFGMGPLHDLLETSRSLPALPKFLLSHSSSSSLAETHSRQRSQPFAAEPMPLLPISWVARQASNTPTSPVVGPGLAAAAAASAFNPRDEGAVSRDAGRSAGILRFRLRPAPGADGKPRALLAFTHGNDLHAGVVDPSSSHATFLPEPVDAAAGADPRTDVKLCPDADLVSYVRGGDIYAATVPVPGRSVREHRITFSSVEHPGGGVTCGAGEYVMQEEFGRRTGYWWAPAACGGGDRGPRRMLYLQVDERGVEGVHLPRPGMAEVFGLPGAAGGAPGDRVPYPRAGGKNARCEPRIAEMVVSPAGDLEGLVHRSLRGEHTLDRLFPWMEYVIRAGWLPDGQGVWFQLLDRAQQRLALVRVPLDLFRPEGEDEGSWVAENGDLHVEVLWEEHTSLWINAHDCLRFVEPPLFAAKPVVLAFLFASERTGFRHLYHVAVHAGSRSHVRTYSNPTIQPNGSLVTYPHCTIRQLTAGPYPACASELAGVDEHRHLAYFHGKRDDPTETHLYACSYAEGQGRAVETVDSRTRVRGFGTHHHHSGNGTPHGHHPHHHHHWEDWDDHVALLTEPGKSHQVTMNDACTRFVDVASSVADPPECRVFDLVFEPERDEHGSPPRRGVQAPALGLPRDVPGRERSFSGASFSESFASNRSRANSRSSATFVAPPAIVRPKLPRARLLATLPNPKRADTMDDHGEMELVSAEDGMFRMQLHDHESAEHGHGRHEHHANGAVPAEELFERDHALSTPLPVMFSFANSANVVLYGMLYYPDEVPGGGDLPTIVRVYGGPNAQVVTNDWKSPQWMRIFLALRLGYCVLIVDNRGSWDRGLVFEAPLQGRFATVEVMDQIEALLYVMCCTTLGEHLDNGSVVDVVHRLGVEWTVGVDSLDSVWARCKAATSARRKYHGARRLVDPDRIAVTGWSYGGYLSLMMLAQHPNIVRVAVAGAPVTQWSLYDTAYTERFLSRPSDNPGGYSRSSVLDVAHCLPDEENRLLIVHGAMDENVHITHSLMLVSALVKLNKPHQIQIYPNERHGLRQPGNAEHYDTLFFHFLARAFRDVERA